MDSINAQQPEDNLRNLSGDDALERIRDTVAKSSSCFFCTAFSAGGSVAARPMSVRQVDDDGALWFLSASDSHKNAEIGADSTVRLFFQGSEHADFMCLTGRATIYRERNIIESLWQPLLKVWFTEGVDDPRITAVRVDPVDGYYWDNKHGTAVAGIKMLLGAAIGKTLDDSVEGRLKL